MDDRFDFIFADSSLFDGEGLDYVPGSYTTYGNDGNHFNDRINSGQNAAVGDQTADALYYASDHLPVYLELSHPALSVQRDPAGALPERWAAASVHPNPFNSAATVRLKLRETGTVRVAVHDMLGRRVAVLRQGVLNSGAHSLTFDGENLASGVYLLTISREGHPGIAKRLVLVR
jgi:hypothetical protein